MQLYLCQCLTSIFPITSISEDRMRDFVRCHLVRISFTTDGLSMGQYHHTSTHCLLSNCLLEQSEIWPLSQWVSEPLDMAQGWGCVCLVASGNMTGTASSLPSNFTRIPYSPFLLISGGWMGASCFATVQNADALMTCSLPNCYFDSFFKVFLVNFWIFPNCLKLQNI